MKGELVCTERHEFCAACKSCGATISILAYGFTDANGHLTAKGWRQEKNSWLCSICARDIAPDTVPLNDLKSALGYSGYLPPSQVLWLIDRVAALEDELGALKRNRDSFIEDNKNLNAECARLEKVVTSTYRGFLKAKAIARKYKDELTAARDLHTVSNEESSEVIGDWAEENAVLRTELTAEIERHKFNWSAWTATNKELNDRYTESEKRRIELESQLAEAVKYEINEKLRRGEFVQRT